MPLTQPSGKLDRRAIKGLTRRVGHDVDWSCVAAAASIVSTW